MVVAAMVVVASGSKSGRKAKAVRTGVVSGACSPNSGAGAGAGVGVDAGSRSCSVVSRDSVADEGYDGEDEDGSEKNPVGRRLPAGGKSPTRPKERAANAVNGKVRAVSGSISSSTTTKTVRQTHAKGQAAETLLQLRQVVARDGCG
jgi:hypothetical protein